MTVAHAGKGWRLAPSLIALEAEADRLAPRRSRRSDGSIGDAAHRTRKSQHNPEHGWVCALDLTHDPAGGFDAHGWAQRIADRKDPRVRYVITNRRIWQPRVGWSVYGGPNPHNLHTHVSIWNTPAARDDLSPWLVAAGHHRPPPAPTWTPPAAVQPPPYRPPAIPEEQTMFVAQSPEFGSRLVVIDGDTVVDIGLQPGADAKGAPIVPMTAAQLQHLRASFPRSVAL